MKFLLKTSCAFFVIIIINIVIVFDFSFANNLTISNVHLGDRNPATNNLTVEFDVTWKNSWKTKFNHDAIWLNVRLYNPSVTPTYKSLCQLTNAGINPVGTSAGSNSNFQLAIPSDKKGAFLRPTSYGVNSTVSTTGTALTVDYSSCGFEDSDTVYATVTGLEMVYVPQGAFYAGDFNESTASLVEGSSDIEPWYISSESALSVTNATSNGYRYVSGGNAAEDATGASFAISSDFPKGYGAFYAMKYELTEGQWVEFLNALPSDDARRSHDLTDSSHKNTDLVSYRNTISCSGAPLTCATSRPARALNYVTWPNLLAYLDWAGLRPMTELEFEKICRGPMLSVPGEYAWGADDIVAAAALTSGPEDGNETITTTDANAHYDNQTLSGGDSVNGAGYEKGPIRSGIFATASSDRQTAGAAYYGVMDLSGNVRERVVTIGNASGRSFQGTHGDGILSSESGYEGYATNSDWPGIDQVSSRGVTGAGGSGFRGGGWDESVDRLRVSDRQDAAKSSTASFNNAGGRGVRTFNEN